MRVLLISHTCQSRTEGQPKAAALAKIPGIELEVLIPDRWRHYGKPRAAEPPPEGSFQYRIGKVRWPWVPGAQFYLHYYPQLAEVLQRFRPDVIDLWEEPWGLVSAHACFLRDRILPDARIVSETEQNIDKQLPPPFEWFRKYVLRRADFLVGRSTEAVEVGRRKGFSGDAAVVPNGVDTGLFRPLNRAVCRQASLGIDPARFVAGYVGRLVPEKGLADLVEAVRLSPANVHLVMVGGGEMEAELHHQIAAAGIANRVHLLPARNLQLLPEVMNALDVLVLPSRTTARWKEQFGRVLIEAQACGTPVIGTASGAIPDVVGAAGIVVPERNPAALADAIKVMMRDPEGCKKMGDYGRSQAAECSWSGVAGQMAEIYRSVYAVPERPARAFQSA